MEAFRQVRPALLSPALPSHPAKSPLDAGDTVSSGVNCSFDADLPRRHRQMDAAAFSSYTAVPFREITFNPKLTRQPRHSPQLQPGRKRHLSPLRPSDFAVPSTAAVPRPPPALHRKTQSLANPMTAAILRKRPQNEKARLRTGLGSGRRAKSVSRRTVHSFVCQKREADRVFYYFGKRDWKAAEI